MEILVGCFYLIVEMCCGVLGLVWIVEDCVCEFDEVGVIGVDDCFGLVVIGD